MEKCLLKLKCNENLLPPPKRKATCFQMAIILRINFNFLNLLTYKKKTPQSGGGGRLRGKTSQDYLGWKSCEVFSYK